MLKTGAIDETTSPGTVAGPPGLVFWTAILACAAAATDAPIPAMSRPGPWICFLLGPLLFAVVAWGPRPKNRWDLPLVLLGVTVLGHGALYLTGRAEAIPGPVLGDGGPAPMLTWLHANELAGVLSVLLPIALSRALATPHRGDSEPHRPWLGTASACIAVAGFGLLLATESRTGLGATLLGSFLVLWGLVRRRIAWFAVPAALAATVVPGAWGRLERFALSGQAEGWSLDTVLTGRPEIWDRASRLIADFPARGVGVGGFSDLVPALYPWSQGGSPVEDSHQLYLELALALGLPGLLAFLGLTVVAVSGLLPLDRGPSADRAWRVGIAGALAAGLLYGLADALAPGRPGHLVLWLVLGLAAGARPASTPRIRDMGIAMGAGLGLAAACWLALAVAGLWQLDRGHRLAARALLVEPELRGEAQAALEDSAARFPRALWLRGWLDGEAGAENGDPWHRLLNRSPRRLPLVAAARPEDADLAKFATRRWPQDAGAWIWRGRAALETGEDRAAGWLARGLSLDPSDPRAWLDYGALLERSGDLSPALGAYYEACRRGDPGANACGRGGHLAKQLGHPGWAVELYRRSRWPPIRARAEALERELSTGHAVPQAGSSFEDEPPSSEAPSSSSGRR
ncbi:MAG: O-antigen ligase family protein [Acidobacteriota bacterium]